MLCALFSQPKVYKSVIDDVINEVRELFLDEGVDEQVLLELKTVHNSTVSFSVNIHYTWENLHRHTPLFSQEGSKPLNKHFPVCSNFLFYVKYPPPPSYFSCGKTNYCSQRQWKASTRRSRRLCRLHSNSSTRSNRFSRWPSQRRPSKSSCLRSRNSKVSQR